MNYVTHLAARGFVLFMLAACGNLGSPKQEVLSLETDFNAVEINGEYQMMIPKYMKEASALNDDASLQYQNLFKEAYVVVIDESKEEFVSVFRDLGEYNDSLSVVENYRDIQLKYLVEGTEVISVSKPVSKKINERAAEVVELDGNVEGVAKSISYYLTFVEGDKQVYMIMAWTLQDRKERFRDTYEKIANSFRLL